MQIVALRGDQSPGPAPSFSCPIGKAIVTKLLGCSQTSRGPSLDCPADARGLCGRPLEATQIDKTVGTWTNRGARDDGPCTHPAGGTREGRQSNTIGLDYLRLLQQAHPRRLITQIRLGLDHGQYRTVIRPDTDVIAAPQACHATDRCRLGLGLVLGPWVGRSEAHLVSVTPRRWPIALAIDPPVERLTRVVKCPCQRRGGLLSGGIAKVPIRVRLRDTPAPRLQDAPMIDRCCDAE